MNRKISLGAAISFMAVIAAITFTITMIITLNMFNDKVFNVKEREELYKKIIEIAKVKPKTKSPNALTRHINETLQFNLLAFDGIHYEPPPKNGGSSGRKMYFTKPKKDI